MKTIEICGMLAFAATGTLAAADTGTERIAPIKAPFEMPQLQRPNFPDSRTSIVDFGAVEGGATKNTAAFANAIDASAKKGGGRVVVPKGKWLTGPIHFKSNIDLHLEDGAEIIFSDKFEDYLPPVFVRAGGVEIYNYSPLIYARDCENIAITGAGYLNGNAKAWWDWAKRETKEQFKMGAAGVPLEKRVFGTPEARIRPSFVGFVNCRNVLLEGFKIGSGPNWTIHPIYCENIIIRRVNVDTHGPNNDGIDPDSCRNLLVEYCTFNTGDDCMVLKSGYNQDGWRVGKPTENVVMRHCTGKEGHGGLVIGSEMSGDVRNVYMHDCQFDGTDHALRIKSRIDRGGIVENVWVENVVAKNMQRDVVILNMDYSADRQDVLVKKPPLFRNVHVKNVTADGAPVAIIITGVEESPIQDIHFEDMTITSKQGVVAKHVKNLTFKNVKVSSSDGPVFDLTNASGITIEKAVAPKGGKLFLKLQGAGSDNVVIQSSDLSGMKQPIQLGVHVPESAVTVR
ncbi:MAG: glycoside hydrolase family 28 protein [Verrucomicrobiota bacterium]